MREVVYAPLGVITQPNKYGKYPPGALKNGVDVCMRDPGVLRPINEWETYQALDVANVNYTSILRMWALSASFLTACYDSNTDEYAMYWGDGTTTTAVAPPTGGVFSADEAGIVQMVRARDRSIVTHDFDPWVLDEEEDATARYIGLPQPPNLYVSSVAAADPSVFATNKCARYAAVFMRRYTDGYVLRSAPWSALLWTNASGSTVDPTLRVDFENADTLAALAAGDFIELYRTDLQTTGTDPGVRFLLVNQYELTSTDITNTYALITDRTPDLAGGIDLYTNSGMLENGVNGAPGQCVDAFNLKGYTWYAEREVPSYLSVRLNAKWGTLTTDADRTAGIGFRDFTGTSTIGSPIITGVSNVRGIAVGQYIDTVGLFPGTNRVIAVGATTVTVDANATGAATTSFSTIDIIEINGVEVLASFSYQDFLRFIGQGETGLGAVTTGAVIVPTSDVLQTTSSGVAQSGVSFVVRAPRFEDGAVTVRATNGQNYSPPLPSLTEDALEGSTDRRNNRLVTSKLDQPEAVVPGVETVYGNGTHYRAITRRDSALLFASDGLWQLSGEGGQWRTDLIDADLVISARNAVCQLGGVVYAHTERGIVAITEGNQILPMTNGVIGDQLPGLKFRDTWRCFMESDEQNDEVWIVDDVGAETTMFLNVLTKAWFTRNAVLEDGQQAISALAYAPYLEALGFGMLPPGGESSTGPRIRIYDEDAVVTTCLVDFQPLTGDGNAFSAKQWTDFILMFLTVETPPLVVNLRFSEAYSHQQSATTIDGSDYRVVSGVPMANGIAPRIMPGFETNNDNAWALGGISLRFDVVSEEYLR